MPSDDCRIKWARVAAIRAVDGEIRVPHIPTPEEAILWLAFHAEHIAVMRWQSIGAMDCLASGAGSVKNLKKHHLAGLGPRAPARSAKYYHGYS